MTTENTVAVGTINFRMFDLKMLHVSKFEIFESNLFHSIIFDGKHETDELMHINMVNNVYISSSMLTIRLWNYIKKVFRALGFLYIPKKDGFLYQYPWQSSSSTCDS